MGCVLPQVDVRGADTTFFAYGRAIDEDDDDDDDYDGKTTLPASPYGLTFFHGLRIGPQYPVPRFKAGTALSLRAFHFFFGIEFEDIQENFFRPGHVNRPQPIRSKNKVRQTQRYVPNDDAPSAPLFHLRAGGVQLLPATREERSDSEMEEDQSEDEVGRDEINVDGQLTKLWRQFIVDVTEKVPNRKRADEDGYCVLSATERRSATDAIYQSLRLSDFFNDCQWKVGKEDEWDATFDHLFPLQEKRGKVQNYGTTLYYNMWQKIKDRSPDQETVVAIRRALKSKFDMLLWFPCAQADRIWPTASNVSRFKKFVDPRGPAPWVLCRRRPTWR
jgi:hypothetical protein